MKLGPRGLRSVFVGYAQNSKAYSLLDLESNVIVELVHILWKINSSTILQIIILL